MDEIADLRRQLDAAQLARTAAEQRAEDEKRRAEDEKRRAEDEKRRAEDEKRRAEDEKRCAEDEKHARALAEQRAEDENRRAEDEKRRAEDEKRRAEDEKHARALAEQRAEDEKQRAERAELVNYGAIKERAMTGMRALAHTAGFTEERAERDLRGLSELVRSSLATLDADLVQRIQIIAQGAAKIEQVAGTLSDSSVGIDADDALPVQYLTGQSLSLYLPSGPANTTEYRTFSSLMFGDVRVRSSPFPVEEPVPAGPAWFRYACQVLDALIVMEWAVVNRSSGVEIASYASAVSPMASSSSSSSSSSGPARLKPPHEGDIQYMVAWFLQVCGRHFGFRVLNATGAPRLFLDLSPCAAFPACKGKTDLLLLYGGDSIAVMIEMKVVMGSSDYLAQTYSSLAALTSGLNGSWSLDDAFDRPKTALPIGLLFNGCVFMRSQFSSTNSLRADSEVQPLAALWRLFRSLQAEREASAAKSSPSGPFSPRKERPDDRDDADKDPPWQEPTKRGKAKEKARGRRKGAKGGVSEGLSTLSLSAMNILAHQMDLHGERVRDWLI